LIGGDGHGDVVNWTRHVSEVAVAFEPENVAAIKVYGVNVALKLQVYESFEELVPGLVGVRRSSKNGNGFRIENLVQLVAFSD
jgi:hypothetical protein